eukprot:g9475.t1
MLTRGPAYWALSLRWPASVVPSGGPVSSSSSTLVAVVSPSAAAAAVEETDGPGAEWEASERGLDEAFKLATAAAAAAARGGPRFAVFRRSVNADASPVDDRAATVARLIRYSQKTQ